MHPLKHLIDFVIKTFLNNPNQFASGGILLMALGAAGAMLRKIPSRIWQWCVHQTTVTLSVTDDQRAFYWLKIWLEGQRIMKRTRHMDVMSRGSEKYVLLPAPGHHWMLYKGRIVSISYARTEEKKLGQTERSEALTFTTFGRKQDIFRVMMQEVRDVFVKQEEKKPELHAWGTYAEWKEIHAYLPRPLDSVIIPRADKDRLVQDIQMFRHSRDWYTMMGIPYRKGYLFYGPPGTGKTSLVTGLSSHFNENIYILKLADMTDTSLREAITQVDPNSFIVIEDVDCVTASHARDEAESKPVSGKVVTLSGLLNVIDGLFSPVGAIFILTTNHIEKLDAALIRPGRIDLKLLLTYATAEQKQELYNRFFPGLCDSEFLEKEMTMADLQQALMEKQLDNQSAVA